MNIETRKEEFVEEFLKIQNEELITKFEEMLRKEFKHTQDEDFESMSIEEFNKRIDKSMEDSKNGKLIKAKDLKVKMKKWR